MEEGLEEPRKTTERMEGGMLEDLKARNIKNCED